MKPHTRETLKYILRSYPVIRRYVREVEGLHKMSREDLKRRNNERFVHIVRKAYAKSPFYRQLYDEAGVDVNSIHGVEDIERLPIITKDMVRQHYLEMTTIPQKFMLEASTSGTTGSAVHLFETWPSLWREQAYLYYYRRERGFTYGKDVLVSLRGNLTGDMKEMWVGVSKTHFMSSYNLRPEIAPLYHKIIESRKPKAIEGFPSSLYTLACYFEDQGLSCSVPVCFTSSETLLDHQRVMIERVFHTKIFDWYGVTERTVQLVEHKNHHGYYEHPGYGILENRPDGAVTTSLINGGFPMIRYKIDDAFDYEDERIVKIHGRLNANIIGCDGTPYIGTSLFLVMRVNAPIRYAQFVQHRNGHIDLNVVPHKGLRIEKAHRDELYKKLDTVIGLDNLDISVNEVNETDIIYTGRGKYNLVVNEKD